MRGFLFIANPLYANGKRAAIFATPSTKDIRNARKKTYT